MAKIIMIKVLIRCDKCRSKAMSVASLEEGVDSVSITGQDKDLLMVIGEGVDSVDLTKKLRKKMGHATLITVEEVKEEKEKKKEEKEKKEPQWACPHYHPCQSRPVMYAIVEDTNTGCSIM